MVFTNGCFDLLHAGHIRFLEEARRLGDVLVVAVDSDESVRQVKGEGRPIIGEGDRLRILAALTAVDYVTVFAQRSIAQLSGQPQTRPPRQGQQLSGRAGGRRRNRRQLRRPGGPHPRHRPHLSLGPVQHIKKPRIRAV